MDAARWAVLHLPLGVILGFVAWFVAAEIESPGLSFAAALIAVAMLAAALGLSKCKGSAISREGRIAGWTAVSSAVLGFAYLVFFFGSWVAVATAWLALQVPMFVAVSVAPALPGPEDTHTVRFVCPHCQTETVVAAEFIGRSGPCRWCRRTITVPPKGPTGQHGPGAVSRGG